MRGKSDKNRRRYPRALRERYEVNAELRLLRAAHAMTGYADSAARASREMAAMLNRVCEATGALLAKGLLR